MEDSVVAAYVALLLGCIVQDNQVTVFSFSPCPLFNASVGQVQIVGHSPLLASGILIFRTISQD